MIFQLRRISFLQTEAKNKLRDFNYFSVSAIIFFHEFGFKLKFSAPATLRQSANHSVVQALSKK